MAARDKPMGEEVSKGGLRKREKRGRGKKKV
jgi:hypothetical protein